jgi:hypothetical protein
MSPNKPVVPTRNGEALCSPHSGNVNICSRSFECLLLSNATDCNGRHEACE